MNMRSLLTFQPEPFPPSSKSSPSHWS